MKPSTLLVFGVCVFGASASVGIAAGSGPIQDAARSTNDGVYSEAQAARGRALFESRCTACHDTARFTGEGWVQNWAGQPIADLFAMVSATMPEDNPGSLQPQQYADILSFFLKLNGFKTGETELGGTVDLLKSVTIVPVVK